MWLPAATSLTLDYCTNDQCHHCVESFSCKNEVDFEAPATAENRESGSLKANHMAAVDSDFDGYDTAMAMAASGAGQIRAVPESQHALMSAAMLDAKRARMKVENDREALANRIARLQAEELRATKRIEQTVCARTSCYDCTLLASSFLVF